VFLINYRVLVVGALSHNFSDIGRTVAYDCSLNSLHLTEHQAHASLLMDRTLYVLLVRRLAPHRQAAALCLSRRYWKRAYERHARQDTGAIPSPVNLTQLVSKAPNEFTRDRLAFLACMATHNDIQRHSYDKKKGV
jgi:hypothetical protein